MAKRPIEAWCIALVVVRLGDRFLAVHERKHGGGWHLPAGRVEPGETFVEAAVCESKEEAGVDVLVDGVLRVEHSRLGGAARFRVLFTAQSLGDTTPKQRPDGESQGAAWVTLEELAALPLRGSEVRELFAAVAGGMPVYPLSLLTHEGSAFQDHHRTGR